MYDTLRLTCSTCFTDMETCLRYNVTLFPLRGNLEREREREREGQGEGEKGERERNPNVIS